MAARALGPLPGARPHRRSWPKFVGIAVLVIALAALGSGLWVLDRLGHPPKAYRYRIPEAHVGWFVVRFGVPSAPALPVENGWHIVEVPVEGVIQTSDAMIGGGTMSAPVYVAGGVERGPATTRRGFSSQTWEAINSKSGRVDAYTFVGEPTDADEWTERRDEKGNPIPGLRPRSMSKTSSPEGARK